MVLQLAGDLHEFAVSLGQVFGQVLDLFRIADTGYHILTLGIEQVIAIHLFLASGWITRERHTGARVRAHIAKDHGHDIDRRAKVMSDASCIAVIYRALAIPGTENCLCCQAQLFVWDPEENQNLSLSLRQP